MNLTDLVIPPWVRLAAVAVVAAILIGFGWWLGGLGPRAELADERTARATDKANWEKLRADGEASARKREGDLQTAADTAREDLDHARATIKEQDSRIARLSVDSGRLRSELAAYAAGAGDPNPGASCPTRAAALAGAATEGAELLAEGVGLLREAALAHDERAAEVRALLQAWPKNHAEDH